MVDGKIIAVLCAVLAAGLVTIASALSPTPSDPPESLAGISLSGGEVTSASPAAVSSNGWPVVPASEQHYASFEVLSAVATPILVGDAQSPEVGQGLQPLEARLLGLLNDERMERGLAPLQVDDRLVALARKRSGDMAGRNYFSHVTPEGEMVFKAMDAEGIAYSLAGENLARNRAPLAETAEVAHRGFMNSPSHRENELEPVFDRVGIGMAISEGGVIYFTELFIAAR